MERGLNPFDERIKTVYESSHPSTEVAGWDALNKKLDALAPSPINYFIAMATGVAVVAIIFLMLSVLSNGGELSNNPVLVNNNSGAPNMPKSNEQGLTAAAPSHPIAEKHTAELIAEDDSNRIDNVGNTGAPTHTEPTVDDSKTASPMVKSVIGEKQAHSSEKGQRSEKGGTASRFETLHEGDAVVKASGNTNKRMVHTSCKGLTIQFEASEDYGKDAKFLWNFGDGFFSNEAKPAHTFNKSGIFDVALSVTSASTGQISSNVVQASIQVLEAPEARIELEVRSADVLQINNLSLGGDQFEFGLNGETFFNTNSLQLPISTSGSYHVDLAVLNASGCVDTLKHIVMMDTYLNIDSAEELHELWQEDMPMTYIFSEKEKLRHRSPIDVESLIKLAHDQGPLQYIVICEEKDTYVVKHGRIALN